MNSDPDENCQDIQSRNVSAPTVNPPRMDHSRRRQLLAGFEHISSEPLAIGFTDGAFGLVNGAFERLLGYSRHELQNLRWSGYRSAPESRENERRKLAELQRTGQPAHYEKTTLRKDGTLARLDVHVHLMHTPSDGTYYLAFVREIPRRDIENRSFVD